MWDPNSPRCWQGDLWLNLGVPNSADMMSPLLPRSSFWREIPISRSGAAYETGQDNKNSFKNKV